MKTLKSILGSVFKSAVNEDLITKNPMVGTLKVTKTKKKVDIAVPTEEEVKRILEIAKGF